MAITLPNLVTAAKSLAQDAGPGSSGTGVQLLLTDPGDYNAIILNGALRVFDQDRPNLRVVDYAVTATAFLFQVAGAGTPILPTTGLDAWIDGGSVMQEVWWPYRDADQSQIPNDENSWRLRRAPGGVVYLEFLFERPAAGQVIRSVYSSPHVVDAASAAATSVLLGDVQALTVLCASLFLQEAAVKMAQNTGNTGLPNDVVDRRTQSDIMRSRSKELRDLYAQIVGQGKADDVSPASGFKDLDLQTSHRRGFLFHPTSTH